jgi:PAS domain S-box-containing protein
MPTLSPSGASHKNFVPGEQVAVPAQIARVLAEGAQRSRDAYFVGSRTGMIVWANPAWTRITGRTLAASISKPVEDLLDSLGMPPAALRAFSRCFRQGRTCELETSLEGADGKRSWIQLNVEPLHDSAGHVDHFIAVVKDMGSRQGATDVIHRPADLTAVALRAAREIRVELGPRTAYDFSLTRRAPLVALDDGLMSQLVEHLLRCAAQSVGSEWGSITLSTGILGQSAEPLFEPRPRDDFWHESLVYLEVHDTGSSTADAAIRRVSRPLADPEFSVCEIVTAARGRVEVQRDPCGSVAVLLLFPF